MEYEILPHIPSMIFRIYGGQTDCTCVNWKCWYLSNFYLPTVDNQQYLDCRDLWFLSWVLVVVYLCQNPYDEENVHLFQNGWKHCSKHKTNHDERLESRGNGLTSILWFLPENDAHAESHIYCLGIAAQEDERRILTRRLVKLISVLLLKRVLKLDVK